MSDAKGYKETEIGTIPAEWDVVPLGNLADLQLGRTPPRKQLEKYWENGKIPWVSISDLNNGFVNHTSEKVSEIAFDEVFRQRISPAGTLLMSFKLTIGRVGILEVDAVHNEAIVSIFLNERLVHKKYLFYLLQHFDYDDFIDSYVKGKTLNKGKLIELPIPLPPLDEQRRIAAVLSTIQKAIEKQERVIQAARELKRSLMHRLFTYGPYAEPAPTKETEIGDIPEHWEVTRLGDLAFQVNSGATPRGGSKVYQNHGVPFIRSQNVLMNQLSMEDIAYISEDIHKSMQRSQVEPGDVLLNITGASIGRVTYVPESLPVANVNQHVCRIRVNTGEALPQFVSYHLSKRESQAEIMGTQFGTTRQGLNYGQVRMLRISLPPLKEQTQIIRNLDSIENKIAVEINRKQSLEALFKSMLHQLMTGQIRVRASDE